MKPPAAMGGGPPLPASGVGAGAGAWGLADLGLAALGSASFGLAVFAALIFTGLGAAAAEAFGGLDRAVDLGAEGDFWVVVFLAMGRASLASASGSPFCLNASSHKTEAELNGEPVVFAMLDAFVQFIREFGSRQASMAAVGAAAVAAAGLAGCADLPSRPFTPPPPSLTSPLAADIQAYNARKTAYPGWISMPSQPVDVRPASAWTRNIYNVLRERRQMQALQVLYPQSLYGAEAFAKEQRSRAAAPLTPEQATAQRDQTAAFARQTRERAKPPSGAH